MNVLKVLSATCPNISAQRIYVGLYMLNDDNFGTLREVSYEWLAVKLAELGFRTERGERFTRRTVWGRLNELCRAGLADVDKNRDGSLDIAIFAATAPLPDRATARLQESAPVGRSGRNQYHELSCEVGGDATATAPLPDRATARLQESTPVGRSGRNQYHDRTCKVNAAADERSTATAAASNTSEDGTISYDGRCSIMESTTQNGTEIQENFACATKEEYNNININKQINKISLKDAVAKVDFSDPRIARFREKVARAAYETNMHADLIDRAVAAVALGYATSAELKAAIEASKDSQRQLRSTNGFKGKRCIWQTLALYVKSWFDAVGLRWIPTSFRREPAPKPLVKFTPDSPQEDDVTTDEKGRTIIRRR